MQAHHQSLAHPESPVFENINQQHIHQDSYNHQNNMYSSTVDNNLHAYPEYATEHDSRKFHQQPQHKHDGFSTAYRSNFNLYPNATRQRHQVGRPPVSSNSYREQPASFYPTSAADVFPPSVTSPTQPHIQAFDTRSNYDFGGQINLNGVGNGSKSWDIYNPSVSMLQTHTISNTKISQQQQSQHGAYPTYPNGHHLSSQTPYGPHLPAASAAVSSINGTNTNTNANTGTNSGPPPGLVPPSNGASLSTSTEEISTIFVVGFPEDMQEREFQNMFTFSPDFEAATLKIPNKEYTAYGGVGGGPISSAGLRSGAGNGYSGYAGPNDPYNLVTVNQGGVVVDTGRDGTVASWPATVPGEDGHFGGPGGGAGMNVPPRKQIIGFAKFKTRDAALAARDGLQGRRVDIDKGAVLKAEMAKKNLHTKRGVGPVPGGPGPVNSSVTGGLQQTLINGAGLGAGGPEAYSIPSNDMMGAREREMGTLGAMGLGSGRNQWRDQMQLQDHIHSTGLNGIEREDEDRRVSVMNAMGLGPLGSATRGPRERAEDDERERRRREKEIMRLRVGNSTAYDAFHSVALGSASSRHMSNPSSAGLLLPTENEVAGGTSPMMANGHANARPTGFSQGQREEMPGPWDNVRTRDTRPRSPTQRSTSPSLQSNGNAPFFEISPRAASPVEQHSHFLGSSRNDQRAHDHFTTTHIASDSSSSSVIGGSRSTGPSVGGESDGGGTDNDMSRALGDLDVNTNAGKTSPQLPSPASGASSKNSVDQNPPINTLYVGNLPTSPPPSGFPQDYLEESLRDLFSTRAGFRRLCFRHKSNGPMCFVEFEDVQYATKALNDLYGNNLKGLVKGGIRLSYSKNPLGVRTPTSAGSNGPLLQQQQLQSNHTATNNSHASAFTSEFQPRLNDEQRAPAILRRDVALSSSHQPFAPDLLASPPRFFSSSPSGLGNSSTSTPLTSMSSTFIPRFGYGLSSSASSGQLSTFSPFGLSATPPPHSTIPDHQTSDDHLSASHPQHFVHNFSPANNLEATRASN